MGTLRTLFRLTVLAAGLCATAVASAQPGLGAVRDTVRVADGPVFALRTNVVPGSEALWLIRDSLTAVRLDTAQYRFDYAVGGLSLRLTTAVDSTARLAVHYRVLDLGLEAVYARRRVAEEEPDTLGMLRVIEVPPPGGAGTGTPLFGTSQLQRRGSITRGVIAGNNRDVSVESGLRMELSGPITDDVTVQAVLTDENTPIQPEGTTQQLSEFDRVYIQLDAPSGQARLGDVDLSITGSEFAAFTRKIQGAAVEGRVPALGAFAGGRVRAAGATTRGIFQSQDLVPLDGVQGPYRLSGQQGETFIIVIAGSERVYLDGVLLTRGENADYVIDYGTGEVTFTPQRLITAERRLTVDFEYTTSRFTRTLLAAEAEAGFWPQEEGRARGRLGVTVLREADAATFGDELGLSEADLDAIAAAGDADVLVPGEERVPYDPESPFVLYVRRDTVVAGETYSIFVPATAEADTVFRVRFTRVPDGTGQYLRTGQSLNGILYEWVGPTGGDYIPFRLLPRPALRRLVDVTAAAEVVPGVELFGEWAGSTNDVNALSDLGSGDDDGQAYLAGVRLAPSDLLGGKLSGEVRRRQQGARFVGFDRTRPVEFNRTWNLARAGSAFGDLDSLREATSEGVLRWEATPRTSASVEGGQLLLGDGRFEAYRGAVGFRYDEPGVLGGALPALDYRLDLVASDDGLTGQDGTFLRQRATLRKPLLGGRLTPLLGGEMERREQVLGDTLVGGGLTGSSVASGSFAFYAVRPGLAWESPVFSATATVEQRREQEPFDGALRTAADATTVETDLSYRPGSSFSTEARVAYRTKAYTDLFRAQGREDNESLAIRWTSRAAPLRRSLEISTVYEALTERTPLLQETYVLVGSELGEFVWRDGQGEPRAGEPDGVPQVDEFFPETTPLEGTYARTFVPSDELFPTIGVQGQVRLRLDPGRLIRDRADRSLLARALRAVSTQTTLDVREKSTERDLRQIYLLNPAFLQQREPRITAEGDTLPPATINGRFRVGQEVTLFPSQPRYGARFSLSHLTSTSRLAAGLETRLVRAYRIEGNTTVARWLALRLLGTAERNESASDAFASRTFAIRSLGVEPQATLTLGPSVGFTLGAAYSDKTNALAQEGEPAGATVFRIPLEVRLTLARRLALTGRLERADVALDGGTGAGLTSFELTEGRGPGVSYLWGLVGQYTINTFLRASLFYDGRAPAEAPVIHTVRMQLSAVF